MIFLFTFLSINKNLFRKNVENRKQNIEFNEYHSGRSYIWGDPRQNETLYCMRHLTAGTPLPLPAGPLGIGLIRL